MHQYTDISASHRPVIALQAYMLLQQWEQDRAIGFPDEGQPVPSAETVVTAACILAQIPFPLIGDFDVSPFYGELHLSWNEGDKQVVLMSFPDRTPLIHHYPSEAGDEAIEQATAGRLAYWLNWLRA